MNDFDDDDDDDDKDKDSRKCRSCGRYMEPHPSEQCSTCRSRSDTTILMELPSGKPKAG